MRLHMVQSGLRESRGGSCLGHPEVSADRGQSGEVTRPPPSVPGGGDRVAGADSSLWAVIRPQTLCCGRESRAAAQKAVRVRSTWVNGVFPP